jgi:hypothetical protein
MRRLTAFVVSSAVDMLVSPLVVYLIYCIFAGRWLDLDEAVRVCKDHAFISILGTLVLIFVIDELGEWAFKRKFWLALVGSSGLIGASIIAIGAIVLAAPPPEQSLQEARAAYLHHDLAAFRNYVDVNAILSDGVDQLVVSPALRDATHTDNPIEGFLAAGVGVAADSWKQAYLPQWSDFIERFVVTGEMPNQSPSDAIFTVMGSGILRSMAAAQWTYMGVAGKPTISGSRALVTVYVRSGSNYEPFLMTLKLRSHGDHWQVVGVQDLPQLLKQLST